MANNIDNIQALVNKENKSREQSLRNLHHILESNLEPSEMFFEIADFLSRELFINKSVLVLKEDNSVLRAVSTWSDGLRQDGLSLNLPQKDSLFEKVIEDGRAFTESFSGSFSGNFFERKLLLDGNSSSYALVPLKSETDLLGLVGFSSTDSSTFAMIDDIIPEEILNRFARGIFRTRKINRQV